ncbi:MAG: hypothetical protein ABEI58_03995 [Candidatus Nanohaloarchaea archaeon]
MTDRSERKLVNGMADHYVEIMPDRDYQMVGHHVSVNGSYESLGILRVNFDRRRIYAEDIRDGDDVAATEKARLVAGDFCDDALMSLADYSCEPMTSVPLANIEPRESLEWDFYFRDDQVRDSMEAEIFFEDVFGTSDISSEYVVETLSS